LEGTYIVKLEELPEKDPYICKLIYYPDGDLNICLDRLKKLEDIGITALILEGDVFVDKYYVLGKGTNSIVIKVFHSNEMKVIKLLRSDASRNTLENEASILKYINSSEEDRKFHLVPKIYDYHDWYLLLEYIDGIPISDYLSYELYELNLNDVKSLIYKLLLKCHLLDLLHVDHGELSNPYRHILIAEPLDPVIIDFESASRVRKVKNLTSILQFLLISSTASGYIRELLNINLEPIFPILKRYKRNPSHELFTEIIKLLGLSDIHEL